MFLFKAYSKHCHFDLDCVQTEGQRLRLTQSKGKIINLLLLFCYDLKRFYNFFFCFVFEPLSLIVIFFPGKVVRDHRTKILVLEQRNLNNKKKKRYLGEGHMMTNDKKS